MSSIEQANEFLNSYLKKFNNQFALHLNTTQSVFEKQPSMEKINSTLAVLSPRKIDSGHSIKYKNKIYIPVSDRGIPYYLKKKTDCMVIESFDGRLYVNVLDELFIMKEIPDHEKHSKEFDGKIKENKPKNNIFLQWIIHGEMTIFLAFWQNRNIVITVLVFNFF